MVNYQLLDLMQYIIKTSNSLRAYSVSHRKRMKYFGVLLLISLTIVAVKLGVKPIIATDPTGRISNGRNVNAQKLRCMAFLDITKGKDTIYCGGTIISQKHVLTAASCLYS